MQVVGHASLRRAVWIAALVTAVAPAATRAQSFPGSPVFVENAGQWDTSARFVLQSAGFTVRLEPDGVWLDRNRQREDGSSERVLLHWSFEGASPTAELVGEQRTAGVHNYLIGNDRSSWRTGLPRYGAVRYLKLYEGIDLLVRWDSGRLEYDLVLEPGADLEQVCIRSDGGSGFRKERDGTLVLDTAAGPLRQAEPLAWEIDGASTRRTVACAYAVHGVSSFGFNVPQRDATRPLVIDPGLEWAASIGGSVTEAPSDLALGDDSRLYVCGSTSSPDFPITPGALFERFQGLSTDAFVSCLGNDGQTLVYSTYLGGPNASTSAEAMAMASGDQAVVVGWTSADSFPVTPGVVGSTKSGLMDIFLTRLSSSGTDVVTSTFYGGSDQFATEVPYGLALGDDQTITVTGTTSADDFPTTRGALQPVKIPDGSTDGFVLRLSADATQVIYSTFLGGTGFNQINDIALYPSGEVVLAVIGSSPDMPVTPGAFDTTPDLLKSDAYVAKLSADGSRLVYGTFLGGTQMDRALAVAAGPNGEAVVVGQTRSSDFPVTPDAWKGSPIGLGDAFVTRLDATGCCLLYSTYFGGGGEDDDFDVALQSSGAITIAGRTGSPNYPTTLGAFQPVKGGTITSPDAFLARLHPSEHSLVYSTFLGGSVAENLLGSTHVALDPTGAAIVTGTTGGLSDFPFTPGTVQSDVTQVAYVAKLDLLATGVSMMGAATPGSGLTPAIGAISMPQVGNDAFALSCTDAPPLAQGALLLSFGSLPIPANLKGAGLWLDPAKLIAVAPQATDVVGYNQVRLAVPSATTLVGLTVYAQYLWPEPSQPGGLLASNALGLVVQP